MEKTYAIWKILQCPCGRNILILLELLSIFPSIGGVIIRTPPTNTTVMAGDDVRFICDVAEIAADDSVFWKRVSSKDFIEVLTYNNQSFNLKKYHVTGQYDLVVHDVQLEDEAIYECQAGFGRSFESLYVSVKMQNIVLEWDAEMPFMSNSYVNLTCRVHHSRPPADIQWYYGDDDRSAQALHLQKSRGADGFGDSSSVLSINVGTETEYIPYRCTAVVPGTNYSRTISSFPVVNTYASGSRRPEISRCLIILAVVAAVFVHVNERL